MKTVGAILITFLVQSVFGESTYTKTLTVPLQIFDGTIRYACTGIEIEPEQYIVEFDPRVAKGSVHHLSVALCDGPYEDKSYWSCFEPHRVCKGRKDAILSQDSHSKAWTLPKDLAIYTGNKRSYIVLQVHGFFKAKESVDLDGNATLHVRMSSKGRKYEHAIHVNVNHGHIPAQPGSFKSESACPWPHNISVPLFNFALHTHSRGIAVSGYIIRDGVWIEIGRGHPLYPKVVYDINDQDIKIMPGDIIAARCTHDNSEARSIEYGFGEEHEMCVFTIHYGIKHGVLEDKRVTICDAEAGKFRWADHFDNIPVTASDTSGDTVQNRYIIKNKLQRITY